VTVFSYDHILTDISEHCLENNNLNDSESDLHGLNPKYNATY